jgi:mannose-1-phosphate guanylyltransferase
MTRDIDAVVLVGGQGTRLRPLTLSAPKPLLATAGMPFLTHLFHASRKPGSNTWCSAPPIRPRCSKGISATAANGDWTSTTSSKTFHSGPGGAIRNVADRLESDTVVIFDGDILGGVDLDALLQRRQASAADVTLHLTRVRDPRTFGCVLTDDDGRVSSFLEKDPHPVTDHINAGTYVYNRSVIESIPHDRPVSVERETFPGLVADGALVMSHLDSAYWRDLGQPADYIAGSADLVLGTARPTPSPVPQVNASC